MKISLIAAMSNNRVIGVNNQLPWHLPADFKYFKETTMGKPVVMGRKTYESIGRPLPGRKNIVLSRNKEQGTGSKGVDYFSSLEQTLDTLQNEDEIFIIGGQTLYEQTLPLADTLYLTIVDTELEGDAFFPAFDENDFTLTKKETHVKDKSHAFDYVFLTYTR